MSDVTKAPGPPVAPAPSRDQLSGADRRAERAAARRARTRRGPRSRRSRPWSCSAGSRSLILTSPGWPEVRDTFFNAEVFRDSFPDIARGLLARHPGLLHRRGRRPGPRPRSSPCCARSTAPALFPLRLLATVYTDVFRGIPTILLVYLVGFGVPALDLERRCRPSRWSSGGIALALSYGAYVSEVYRAGLRSVHRGQRDGGARDRAHRAPGDAPRDPAAGGAPGRAAAAQRLHRPAEGRRPDRDHRGRRRGLPQSPRSRPPTDFNYTPLIAAALLYLAVTIPLARLLDRWDFAAGRR